ncbi:hypothetical protein NP233_g7944 [Leucocoprinus birnbaumii]|uniref:Uncharacterized protein n=1 Tax=Leucocoprinus birnbaumii TaxID=56174 RepID=A0AAD5YSB0_9AGAR|nr:hypothetical protein NP233_g7944 [Leucocoprinus birnbaumii]
MSSESVAEDVITIWVAQSPFNYEYAEVEDFRSRPKNRSVPTAIYLIMKFFGILYFITSLYGRIYPRVTRVMPDVWMAALSIIDIGYLAAVKVILILRLRAIYGNNQRVSILLYTLMAVEMAAGLVVMICGTLVNTTASLKTPFPFPGCWFFDSNLSLYTLARKAVFALATTRFSITSEALNTERKISGRSLLTAIGERRRLTPVLYIFYRDGALLIIPIFVISTLALASQILQGHAMGGVTWDVWLLLTYQLGGSRMILNIRRANGKLIGSIVPEHLSTLRFESRGHISEQESET